MKIRVLGCSGGIGGEFQHTTSLLLDQDILIDAGTGVFALSIDELAKIDHVFLTHTHLDHIAALPLMLDTVADHRQRPLTVYGSAAVINSLKQHIFNWVIWPDFSVLPNAEQPFLRYQTIELAQTVCLDGGRSLTALPVDHTVPAVGYCIASGTASLVFSGDTGACAAFWEAVNQIENLRYLIIECAFSNRDHELAQASKHLCPSLLAAELQKLERECEIYITHIKPSQLAQTATEVAQCLAIHKPRLLQTNQIFEF